MTTPPEAPPTPVPAPPPAPAPDKGFPDATPLTEMSVEQQAAYWKHQARKHEQTVKDRSDYDDLKKQAAEAERLRKERETESEKALREAKEQARREALAESAPRLVAAEFRAALAGRLTDDQRDALIEDINPSRYLNDDGTVDVAKVRERANVLAPSGGTGVRPKADRAQGGGSVTEPGSAGKAEAARRFGKKDQ